MNAPVDTAEFSIHEMLLLQKLLGISEYPKALQVELPVSSLADITEEAITRAEAEARVSLSEQSVIAGNDVIDPTINSWLRVLRRPDIELSTRLWRQHAYLLVSVLRRGPEHLLVMRYGDNITLQPLNDGTPITAVSQLIAPVLDILGHGDTASFEPINLLVAQAKEINDRVAAGAEMYDELIVAGASPESAQFLATHLADPDKMWRAEISALEYRPGREVLSTVGVGVFDTSAGRIVAAPLQALDERMWTTLTPGSHARIIKAVELIIETLPTKNWFAAVRG